MPSISYYLLKLVLRLKGLKQIFQQDPIPYERLRKDDVHQVPKGLKKRLHVQEMEVQGFPVVSLAPLTPSSKPTSLVLYLHGGAFVSGPTALHWALLEQVVATTGQTAWLLNYPKAPEHTADTTQAYVDAVYAKAMAEYGSEHLIVMGDSAGSTLSICLTQRLLVNNPVAIPSLLIAISPVMDFELNHPEVASLDQQDPMLSPVGLRSAKRMYAGSYALNDPYIVPIYGSFKGFPKTYLFIGTADVLSADEYTAAAQMREEGVDLTVIEGPSMPHIWPILPAMSEAKTALNQILEILKRHLTQ